MVKLKLKDVRCFADPQPVTLAPLTLLVGENSTGKSSFLALQRIAIELLTGHPSINFNREPFFLGAYDQIAHYRGGRGGRANSFEIGIQNTVILPKKRKHDSQPITANYTAQFIKRGSQPLLESVSFQAGKYGLSITHGKEASVKLFSPTWSGDITEFLPRFLTIRSINMSESMRYILYIMRDLFQIALKREKISPDELVELEEDAKTLSGLWRDTLEPFAMDAFAIAPVRTKPERTYNPIDDTPKSEGSHVPMVLAKTRFSDRQKWQQLKDRLESFGKKSGLFQEISLKTLGRSDSDPFQIMVKIEGPRSNLIDVGYGVSQVLPIIADIFGGGSEKYYLLQQPEVHLHPRAQAELGSFLGEVVSTTKNRITVETHSDYLIDRVRMDIRDEKNLKPEDVTILFFERKGREVHIHEMFIDIEGNLLKAPSTYRKFFMAEEARFFGLD